MINFLFFQSILFSDYNSLPTNKNYQDLYVRTTYIPQDQEFYCKKPYKIKFFCGGQSFFHQFLTTYIIINNIAKFDMWDPDVPEITQYKSAFLRMFLLFFIEFDPF